MSAPPNRHRERSSTLRVVPVAVSQTNDDEVIFGPLPSSDTYRRVLAELAKRIALVHKALRERGDVLVHLPHDRDLTDHEVAELAWRVYTLACATRAELVRLHPSLVLLAAEWLHSPDPHVWEAFCASQFS